MNRFIRNFEKDQTNRGCRVKGSKKTTGRSERVVRLPLSWYNLIARNHTRKGGGDHYDIIIAFRLGQRFGLRVNESVQVKVGDLEYALRTRQFHVPRGKCGQRRDIPVTTKEQITLLEKLLAYAKKKGKESGDYLLCDNHDNSVFSSIYALLYFSLGCLQRGHFQSSGRSSNATPSAQI